MDETVQHFDDKPGHLARRFQQIAVAVFQSEMEAIGCDLTPVQYAALSAIEAQPGIDQVTLAGVIAFDRTTITGVIDRMASKGWVVRRINDNDRRVRELVMTADGKATLDRVHAGVERAQQLMLRGLSEGEGAQLMALLRKAVEGANDLSRAPMRR